VYGRSDSYELRDRVLSPAMGIRVRHDLASAFSEDQGRMILLTDSMAKIRTNEGKSEHVMQEVLLSAIPAKSPEMLLFMVTQRDDLYPFSQDSGHHALSIGDFGKELLASLYSEKQAESAPAQILAATVPEAPDMANYNQFLISSRIDYQEGGSQGTGSVAVMPQLVGLSLRKGLQRLNDYKLEVKVKGSGQIVSQIPGPGESLQGIGECVLTLGSEI
jgi:cell division protein FtsI (penicillin-binding protein 3)